MKTFIFIPLLFFTASAFSQGAAICDQYYFKGRATTGEHIEICSLTNGEFRFEQRDKGAVAPTYHVDVPKESTALFYQKTEESEGKQFLLEDEKYQYYFEHLKTKGRNTAKASIVGINGPIKQWDIVISTLEDNIDKTIINDRGWASPPDIIKQ